MSINFDHGNPINETGGICAGFNILFVNMKNEYELKQAMFAERVLQDSLDGGKLSAIGIFDVVYASKEGVAGLTKFAMVGKILSKENRSDRPSLEVKVFPDGKDEKIIARGKIENLVFTENTALFVIRFGVTIFQDIGNYIVRVYLNGEPISELKDALRVVPREA